MDAAWASGIRYFDAARSYGKAEEFLQGWLTSRSIPPDQVAAYADVC
jgi:aryl-alcohol dehydrogenase-like predicted oxidoreductase